MAIFHWASLALWACTSLAAPAPNGNPHSHNDGWHKGQNWNNGNWNHDGSYNWDGHYNGGGYGSSSPSVTIKNGTLRGYHSDVYNEDYFLGIPFAQPPVGELRFRTPQPVNASYGTRDATQYSAGCIGYGSDQWPLPSISEDCLYLNVVRPSGYEDQELPVGFWIHGGGLEQGSAIDQRYNLSFIVQRSVEIGKPIIGVSTNYRLSMWGFVTGEEVVESGNANLGFKDQRLAMHWVQENIKAFGGDPSKVTIWGESAGGLSVGMHLTAYGGRDDSLFRAGIMESGNPINYNSFNYNSTDLPTAAAAVGCTTPPYLDCLRTVPYETLNAYINSTAGMMLSWQPIIDGDFIRGKTSLQLDAGEFVKVPIIDGANSDEGTAFGIKPMNTTEQFYQTLMMVEDPVRLTPAQAKQVLAAYPANLSSPAYGGLLVPANQPISYVPGPEYGAASRPSDAYYGDMSMIALRRATVEAWAAHDVPAYSYRFNTIPHGIPPAIGATHFQEVAFVFDNTLGVGYGYPNVSEKPFEGEPQSYYDLADVMSAAWATFIHEGKPTDFWPEYGVGSVGQNWVFDANVTGLGYAEDDDWRKQGIDLINSWNADVYMR